MLISNFISIHKFHTMSVLLHWIELFFILFYFFDFLNLQLSSQKDYFSSVHSMLLELLLIADDT